jgi:oligopeptide/dipeptide ABC transporter ATP-binding protein
LIDRHPRGLSGGERQRVLIARSLALEPEVLICDEPVSSLDTSVRAQVLNLLLDIQRDRELALLFITHDLDVVAGLGAPVVVLYGGQVMERCPGEILRAGRVRHPYTLALLQARPSVLSDGSATGSPWVPRVETEGGPSPEGCPFAHRCPVVEPRCAVERPPPRGIGDGHEAACHLV